MKIKQLIEQTQLNIDTSKIYYNEMMNKHTSFKIGGPAECYIKIHNLDDLNIALSFAKHNNIPITILGNGSNILVLDEGIKGIVLKIDLKEINLENKKDIVTVTVGAGFKLAMLAQILLQNEITGFEELSGIPGTIGGAIKMNAGAHGKEMKDITSKVKCMDYDGNVYDFENGDLDFKYRQSIFKTKKYIILEAQLKLAYGNEKEIKEKMDTYSDYRKQKQPLEYPSAGSTFKRGDDYITAKLIDESGLKGYTIGGATVSTKHSGFIVNKGSATSQDVLELVKYVKEEVYKKTGKKIELEIEIIGEK